MLHGAPCDSHDESDLNRLVDIVNIIDDGDGDDCCSSGSQLVVSPAAAAATAKIAGIVALQKGDFEDAIDCLTGAAKLEPSDILSGQLLELSKLRQWDSRGIPVLQLASYDVAAQLADNIEQAASDAKRRGNDAFRDRNFEDAIKYFAEVLKFRPSDNISAKLFEICNMHLWDESGIPVFRCRSFKAAKQLVEKCKRIDGMNMQEHQKWYASVGFPEEKELGKAELCDLHKKFVIWQSLSLAELQLECERKHVDVRRSSIADDAKQAQQLAKSLLLDERMNVWEARGIEAKRLGDVHIVIQLLQEYDHINQMTLEELRKTYHGNMQFPEEAGITRDDLVGILRKFHFWSRLPPSEILLECERFKVIDVPRNPTEEELHALPWKLVIQDRMNAWESRGIPVKRLGSVDVVAQLLTEYHYIEKLSLEELQEWYKGLGFPLEISMSKDEFVELHRKLSLWRHLPLLELRHECSLVLPSLDAGLAKKDEQEQRDHYLLKLLCHDRMTVWEATGLQVKRLKDIDVAIQLVQTYEDIERLPQEDLKKWYDEFNFPDSEDIDSVELREFRKVVEFWRFLPMSELRVECAKFKISFLSMRNGNETDNEQFQHLMEQLLMSNRMNAWEARGFPAKRLGDFSLVTTVMGVFNGFKQMSDDELKKVSADHGFPVQDEHFDRRHVLDMLKNLVVWESLPAKSLERECHERGLPISIGRMRRFVESKEDEAERRTVLIQRLKMDMQMNSVLARDSEATDRLEANHSDKFSESGPCCKTSTSPEKLAGEGETTECTLTEATRQSNENDLDEQDQKSLADWYDQPELCEELDGSDSSMPELLECSVQEQLDNWYSSAALDVD